MYINIPSSLVKFSLTRGNVARPAHDPACTPYGACYGTRPVHAVHATHTSFMGKPGI